MYDLVNVFTVKQSSTKFTLVLFALVFVYWKQIISFQGELYTYYLSQNVNHDDIYNSMKCFEYMNPIDRGS